MTPATTATSLAAFLEARLDSDQAAAEAALAMSGAHWRTVTLTDGSGLAGEPNANPRSFAHDVSDEALWDDEGALGMYDQTAAHIARHDPARVLAEVAAKRRLIELWVSADNHAQRHSDAPILGLTASAYEAAVRNMAMVWVDHPDFNVEWRAY